MSHQYMPPTDEQLPPGTSRSRASSSASQKYTPSPQGVPGSPPYPSAPTPIPTQGQPRGPLIAGHPVGATRPLVNPAYYGSSPGYFGSSPGPAPQGYGTPPVSQPFQQGYLGTTPPVTSHPPSALAPGRTGRAQSQTPYPADITDASGLMRPPIDERRASIGSNHSRHSHHSGHHDHHHQSRRGSYRSHHRTSEDEYDAGRHSHDSHRQRERRHSDGGEVSHSKRKEQPRPTWGDSIYGVLGIIKDALGPRDKY